MKKTEFQTTWGTISLTLDESGKVVALDLPHLKTAPRNPFAIDKFQGLEGNCVAAQRFASQVQSFFQPLEKATSPDAVSPNIGPERSERGPVNAGQRPKEAAKPIGTPFQIAVWNELKKIPRGQTRTYGEIAAAIGRPKAARAVGTACGANPIPLFIPCHRVVSKNGLGGFGSGLPWKKLLLKLEGWNDGRME